MIFPLWTAIRCTFSYPNWVFVFMASVNYIWRCHGSFWTVSHVMTSTEGNDGKQCHECPIYDLIGFQWLPIWSQKAGTTSLPAIFLRPLASAFYFTPITPGFIKTIPHTGCSFMLVFKLDIYSMYWELNVKICSQKCNIILDQILYETKYFKSYPAC